MELPLKTTELLRSKKTIWLLERQKSFHLKKNQKAPNGSQRITKMARILIVEDHQKGNKAASVAQTLKSSAEADVQPRKRKLQNQKEERDLKRRIKPKKSTGPDGKGAVDKLDMLIEQYRSKFSRQSSEKTDGEKQGSRQLRRWFQS